MARMGDFVNLTVLLTIATAMWLDGVPRAVEAQQFGLIHTYAHLEGSSAKSGGKGMSPDYFETLRAHDRRRLAAVIDFPLQGSFQTIGLYYTQISLGTPPRQYNVIVDTGSFVTWINCSPCPTCQKQSEFPGITLTQYDPSKSSTVKILPCQSPDCQIASFGIDPVCTDPSTSGACPYKVTYYDGGSTSGYFLNDVMTFNMVANSTNIVSTANVYFGCAHTQSGNFNLDGLMGFAQAAISVPQQLSTQKKTGGMFAHCLRGADIGGGNIVMGNITEPDIVYTPILSKGTYDVGLQNIAVNGVNITTAASFDIKPGGTGGCTIDSGTTRAFLIQPVYDQFVAAVSNIVPVRRQTLQGPNLEIPDCFIYNGSVVGTFPEVKLFFNGGAMNLGPMNYLIKLQLDNGGTAYCIYWAPSDTQTIFGDIVLQDQLIVYDLDKQRVGWKPFDCTKSISVENGTDSTALLPDEAQAPSPDEIHSGAHDSRMRMSAYLLSSCLVFAFLRTWL